MASPAKGVYRLQCNNYASTIAESFKEMLQQKQLIDVVLAVDNHLFNAHRLVLSAFSPYFRQLLHQIPATQQAYGINSHIFL